MYHLSNHTHRVYLVDLEQPLLNLLSVIADYTEEGRLFSEKDILMMALNLLNYSPNLHHAAEAMEIEIEQFCHYQNTYYNQEIIELAKLSIRQAIRVYLNTMYAEFTHLGLYDNKGRLTYTFGGWHTDYVPIFVPLSHASQYSGAIDVMIHEMPMARHPSQIFTQHPNRIVHPYYEPSPPIPELVYEREDLKFHVVPF